MKKAILVALFFVAGCCPLGGPAQTFLDTVGAEYISYVDSDDRLDEGAKRIRRQHVASFERAVKEANK